MRISGGRSYKSVSTKWLQKTLNAKELDQNLAINYRNLYDVECIVLCDSGNEPCIKAANILVKK